MNLFFTIFGFIFICIFATVTNYIYDYYPINKLTIFLSPSSKGAWGKINVTVFPIMLWSLLEIPIFCNNSMFLISYFLCIIISISSIYVIKYTALLFNKQNNFINLFAIFISALLAEILSFLFLEIGEFNSNYALINIIVVFIMIIIYVLLTIFPPKSSLFKETINETKK